MDKLPKDLANAKRGYEAFYAEQPNIWFEDLSHDYQMKWVRAARAILEENKNYKGPGRKPVDKSTDTEFWADYERVEMDEMVLTTFLNKYVPRNGKVYNYKSLSIEEGEAVKRLRKKLYNRNYKKVK